MKDENGERPTCRTCPYWEELQPDHEADGPHGECRRHAPLPGLAHPNTETFFAETFSDHWCGEHPEMRTWIAAKSQRPPTTHPGR